MSWETKSARMGMTDWCWHWIGARFEVGSTARKIIFGGDEGTRMEGGGGEVLMEVRWFAEADDGKIFQRNYGLWAPRRDCGFCL